MNELIVEVGMKLDKSLIYYHEVLINHGLELECCFVTHDIYFTKENLYGLTERAMKDKCIRLRECKRINEREKNNKQNFIEEENELIENGYKKIFDTIKIDFLYGNDKMKSKVQLQDIKDIGLLVYYDNPDYYKYPLKEQRKMLLNELNSYGFTFKENDLGLDKLRTLYYKKEMYSENQNA